MRRFINLIFTCLLVSFLIGCAGAEKHTITASDIPSGMKVYKYKDYGYEVTYPQEYEVQISGGHSPIANPEFGMRLSLFSKDNPGLDIDAIDKINNKDKYQSIEGFINYKHLNIKLDEEFVVHDRHFSIYKLVGDEYYFSFIENDKYIFQLSSTSKTLLREIMESFKFI